MPAEKWFETEWNKCGIELRGNMFFIKPPSEMGRKAAILLQKSVMEGFDL